MLLDYGTQLSPEPIPLSIGSLKKPRLRDIAHISFSLFSTFQFFMKCTPKDFYTKALRDHNGTERWEAMSDDDKESLTMYSIIKTDEQLQGLYVKMFDFFFEENIRYTHGFFILFREMPEKPENDIPLESICGVISESNFSQVLDLLQQVCCIHSKADQSADDMKFKNSLARKLFEKMQKALKEQEEQKETKADKDLSIPNIISSVASMHPTYNLINIWDLTVFQLLDAFRRMQNNNAYDIERVRVSVWGDEKKVFDPALWHKNYYDT